MRLNATEISELIKQRISQFKIDDKLYNEGKIISVSDGILQIVGLSNVMQGEMLLLPEDNYALALNLERDIVGAVVLGTYINLVQGMTVKGTGRVLEVPVGESLLGRVVNSLGSPIDGKNSIKFNKFLPIENTAPGVIARESVNEPLQTGYKAIDSMIPIGKGQRELIIGDRQTGKTAIAIDTIISQKNSNIKCIYVAIGQKTSTVAAIVKKLSDHHALHYTIIVVASASEAAALQYLAPYSGCAMGEFFRDKGEDALIIYDDLTKHAIAYRQISLLLKRPPGREAFPGDIFYLHARLLERSARINKKHVQLLTHGQVNNKTGSLTALPIIETQSGDVSAFIPTNVISITDGQIFLESNLFNSGIRPAINPGISVSRVGSAAQSPIIKKLSGGIRTALAQYRELAAFSQFSSDLEETTRKQLRYGEKITELLKQKQYSPLNIAEQALLLFSAENHFLDDINLEKISYFEKSILIFFQKHYATLIQHINNTGEYNNNIKNIFNSLVKKFKKLKFDM